MVRKRRITAIDAHLRNAKGAKIPEADWDFKVIPQKTIAAVKEAGIKIDRKTIIPDADTADRIFEAGWKLLVDTGMICIDTSRILNISDDEIRDGIKYATEEVMLGAGRDGTMLRSRKVGTASYANKPVTQGGPTGAPLSEKTMIDLMSTYAQEGVVNTIVNGVLSKFQGTDVLPGSPVEVKAVKTEQQFIHLACANAGRPGMAI
ncbi:MAG: monomethylamine:corrinoid methyltransferase [archaeon]|nr:monomethylamine:corrinoid methyltransferase [archaeon]MCP8306053.1 monomethylamine:corrinoid methyltransferase [archaeon]